MPRVFACCLPPLVDCGVPRMYNIIGDQGRQRCVYMKKRILMIATGGTIASKESAEGLAPSASSEELLSCVPEVAEVCDVRTVQPFNLDSTDICSEHWLRLARIVEENYVSYDGFVVAHGTDTMAYSAAALSYLVQNSAKPIVFTGSQKSVYSRDTDARRNLSDAFLFCADEDAFGVRIVFDGNVILGTRAKKTRTRSFNAFSSIDFPAIAVMRDGKPFYYVKGEKPQGAPVFYHALNPDVFVLKMIPGLSPDIFDYLGSHCDGLVIEAFGAGGIPDYRGGAFQSRLARFIADGKTAVFTTQAEHEGSSIDKYAVGRRLRACGNVLEARCMTLEAAVTKLMWILAFAKGREAERLFYTPVDMDIF